MGSKLLLVVGLSCLPSLLYLVYLLCRRGSRHLRNSVSRIGADSVVQIFLAALSIFCFILSAVFTGWFIFSDAPYYHMQKTIVLAVLFLLMGVFCVQVLQFVRMQEPPQRKESRPSAGRKQPGRPVGSGAWLAGSQRGR